MKRALIDTSILVGLEQGRLGPEQVQGLEWAISVVTLGELRFGLLMAEDPQAKATRLATLELAQSFRAIPIDERVCEQWALLVAQLRSSGRRVSVNDSWIAATALALRVPVMTQNADFDDLPGLSVLRI